MITVGIKFTHDGSVCLFDNNRLIFSVEMEKFNLPRYSEIKSIDQIGQTLNHFGFRLQDVDVFCVDGWHHGTIDRPVPLQCAPYHEFDRCDIPPMQGQILSNPALPFASYVSYNHLSGHIASAYMMSPFAGESAYCLTWDGSQNARLHKVGQDGSVTFFGNVHYVHGIIYGVMAYYFGPYKDETMLSKQLPYNHPYYGGYDKPGKLMSYMGQSAPVQTVVDACLAKYSRFAAMRNAEGRAFAMAYERRDGLFEHSLMRYLVAMNEDWKLSDAAILASVHKFLEVLLLRGLSSFHDKEVKNLTFSGGSALNIKWNTAIRDSGMFEQVFVPPVPNDSGSAIGVACCDLCARGYRSIKWGVYSGPALPKMPVSINGWKCRYLAPFDLGELLATSQEPVIFLHSRAEIGPRALGHRSLLMSPILAENKTVLNNIKKREQFRPVAPLVLQQEASKYFHVRGADPYMLFDSQVTASTRRLAPAVVHIDGSSRVQTLNMSQCPVVYSVLQGHENKTGVPILCNTSANDVGKGFFCDLDTAAIWAAKNSVRYIWSENRLWRMQ